MIPTFSKPKLEIPRPRILVDIGVSDGKLTVTEVSPPVHQSDAADYAEFVSAMVRDIAVTFALPEKYLKQLVVT